MSVNRFGQIVIAYDAPKDLILIMAALQAQEQEAINKGLDGKAREYRDLGEALFGHILDWIKHKHLDLVSHVQRFDKLHEMASEYGVNLDTYNWKMEN